MVTREVVRLARSIRSGQRHRTSSDDFPEYDAYTRRPRRWLVGGAVVGTAAIGVIGTYLALAGGLGGWLLGPSGPANPGHGPGGPGATGAVQGPEPVPGSVTGGVPRPRGSGPGSTGTPTACARFGRGAGTRTAPPTASGMPSPSPSPSPSVSPSPDPSRSTGPPPMPHPRHSSPSPPRGHGPGDNAALGPPRARHAGSIPSTAVPCAA